MAPHIWEEGRSMSGFRCGVCGKPHDDLPRDIAFRRPDPYFGVPEAERERRVRCNDDLCMIDDAECFIRGVLYLPFAHGSGQFGWGAWAHVSDVDFERYMDAWDNGTEDSVPPFPARLASALDPYPGSFGLAVTVKLHSGGQRPLFTVLSEQHPLGVDQRVGITEEKAHSFVVRWA